MSQDPGDVAAAIGVRINDREPHGCHSWMVVTRVSGVLGGG